MTTFGDLHVSVSKSQLNDGSTVFTAYLEEMPGVVAEGASERVAISELIALVRNLNERVPFRVFGVTTAAVASWSWMIQTSGEPALTYGPAAH